MSDEIEKLRGTLTELQAELDNVEQDDPEVRELLRTALAEIQETLEEGAAGDAGSGGGEANDGDSLADRLGSAASHYEESHPNLSGILGGVIDALSRMGI